MRRIPIAALALATTACWTPGPGQVDPTRYPWQQRKPAIEHCVIQLENPAATGIVARGSVPSFDQVPPGQFDGVQMACNVQPNAR